MFLLKALVLFVVIAGGVIAGIYAAVELGLTNREQSYDFDASDLVNRTQLKLGDRFPSLTVYDDRDSALDLRSMLRGQKTIIGFVSDGCEPCEYLADYLDSAGVDHSQDCRVILLTEEPEYFNTHRDFNTFRPAHEDLDKLGIGSFPTVVGIGRDGTILFVLSGYSRAVIASLLDKYLLLQW
jgi:thiol-disulfide isomerase/thioredoxin